MQMLYSLFFASVLMFGGGSGVFLTGGSGLLLSVLLSEYAIFPPLTGGGAAIWVWALKTLTVVSIFLAAQAQGSTSGGHVSFTQKTLGVMMLSLLACFSMDHVIWFYIYFELSALVMMVYILGLGYQPERAVASLLLLLFTAGAALPLLLVLLKMWDLSGLVLFSLIPKTFHCGSGVVWVAFGGLAGFLVKFPMYFVHIWLPKAHVEASASGSMILAGVMLKLGGYGLFRLVPLVGASSGFALGVSAFSLTGGALVSFLCLRMSDLKVLVAYSSVAHMALVIVGVLIQGESSVGGALVMSLAHGMVSSGLFLGIGALYSLSGSRLFILNSNIGSWSPWFLFFWFFFCAANMGLPPTTNFWAELLLVMSAMGFSADLAFLVSSSLFLAVAFSIILYTASAACRPGYDLSHAGVLGIKLFLLMSLHLFFLVFYLVFFWIVFK